MDEMEEACRSLRELREKGKKMASELADSIRSFGGSLPYLANFGHPRTHL